MKHIDEKELVKACLKNERHAQRTLYDLYAPSFLGIALRYTQTKEEAEDILIEGFSKIFSHLPEFRFDCSLHSWMKHIMLNCAISHLRKNKKRYSDLTIDEVIVCPHSPDKSDAKVTEKELWAAIQQMPETYRIIFNLFVVEGFSHKEIGEMLDIQECTSRSQLTRARNWLKERLEY